jgi:hypothetical protein
MLKRVQHDGFDPTDFDSTILGLIDVQMAMFACDRLPDLFRGDG